MFQPEFQMMMEPYGNTRATTSNGGGGAYGEILAPVYEYQQPPPSPSPYTPSYNPQYGYPPPQQPLPPPQQQYYPPAPQMMYDYPPQVAIQYNNSPPPQFDTLIPNVPSVPASMAQPVQRRGLLNTSMPGGSGTSGFDVKPHQHSHSHSPSTCEFCGTTKPGAKPNHSSGCLSIWQHIKSCPVCSAHVHKHGNNRFLWWVILFLVLIVLILWFRLRSMGGGRVGGTGGGTGGGNGGFTGRRRQPYVEAGKLGRLFQE